MSDCCCGADLGDSKEHFRAEAEKNDMQQIQMSFPINESLAIEKLIKQYNEYRCVGMLQETREGC